MSFEIRFYPESDCTGPVDMPMPPTAVLGDTAGAWSDQLEGSLTAPPAALSALASFTVDPGQAPIYDVHLDRLFFYRQTYIFIGGFESGDAMMWSATQPP